MSSQEDSKTNSKVLEPTVQNKEDSSTRKAIDVNTQTIDDALNALENKSYVMDPMMRKYALEGSFDHSATESTFKQVDAISFEMVKRQNIQTQKKKTHTLEVDLALTEENKHLRNDNKNLKEKISQLEDYIKSLSMNKKLDHIS